MFAFLLTLLILDALVLSVVVLLQAGQGGGLASLGGAGGTDTVLGGRQAVTILTKATWWCGGIFLVLSLILSFVPRGGGLERSAGATPRLHPGSAQWDVAARRGSHHGRANDRHQGSAGHTIAGSARQDDRKALRRKEKAVTTSESGVTG